MTLARPKRKAAGNKNYLEAIPETIIDEVVEKPAMAVRNTARKRNSAVISSKSTSPGSVTPKLQSGGKVPYNWQPLISQSDLFSNKLNLAGGYVDMRTQVLTCPEQPVEAVLASEDDELKQLSTLINEITGHIAKTRKRLRVSSFQLKKGDYIYMVSEPPGEPYYVGRIMGFKRKVKEVEKTSDIEDAKSCVFEIQWFYRPRDISKNTSDSRLLFASMHSDTCPLSSYRGRVVVKHRLDVEAHYVPAPHQTKYTTALEYYSSFPNCFYFDKLFDRYMIKFYDIIKTSTLLSYVDNAANNSKHYLLALNKRFEFIFMEASRTKQFINNFHSTSSSHCDICAEWCPSAESVTCGGCGKRFHMLCLDPPLLKKPSRGFSWSCAACTKKHEIEHQSKKTLMLAHDNRTSNEQEILELPELSDSSSPKEERKSPEAILPKYECVAMEFLQNDADTSVEDRRLQEEWSLRYLGIHTKLEDAVDLDDRSPYPRACTNLGAKYQALNIPEYEDHPIIYYDVQSSNVTSNKAKKGPGGRRITKKAAIEEDSRKLPIPKEYENIPPKEFPQWLQPRPKGYIERGVDDGEGQTCTLMWKPQQEDIADDFKALDDYIARCKPIAERLDMFPTSPNFMDAIVKFYSDNHGDVEKSLELANKLTRESLREPTFTKEEIRKFEAGVKNHGSELYPTFKEVKTQSCAMVVRFYYLWKKTKKGRQIWGNYPGRKRKGQNKEGKSDMKILPAVDEFADSEDDSAYENEKIIKNHKLFRCKHCKSYQSQYWFKITGFDGTTKYEESSQAEDIDPETVTALCCRCAKLWRRYAVYWEDPFEVERKNARGIGGYKKKVESELVADAEQILKLAEADGGNLNYDSNKQACTSSVLLPANIKLALGGASTDFFTRTEFVPPPLILKRAPRTSTKSTKVTNKTTPRVTNKEPSANGRSASRQLSIPSKENVKEETKEEVKEPATKATPRKRKATGNGSITVKAETDEMVKPAPKRPRQTVKRNTKTTKSAPAAKQATTTTNRKRKASAETEKQPEPVVPVEKAATPKRQKKSGKDFFFLNPILNPNYRGVDPAVLDTDNQQFANINRDVLERFVSNFKLRQLIDLRQIGVSLPSSLKLDIPFHTFERDCSICLEHDDRADSILEMLICSNCGVNVHASCAGITLLGKQRPIMQWLCEACVNDLSPQYSTCYLCCVCLANEKNTEMSILGSAKAKPDFLMPIIENRKWCHLLCALFTYKETSFRSISTPPFFAKDATHAFYWRPMAAVIESVCKNFIENYESHCGICNVVNGAMIKCDLCEDSETKYHLTCAQDTPKFKIGFKLIAQKASKAIGNAYVGDELGRLEPVLVCPKHEQKATVHSLRTLGRRTQNSELKPLISLFIEDLVKTYTSKLSGPQLRANNYISMVDRYMLLRESVSEGPDSAESTTGIFCKFCSIKSSPKWWPVEGSTGVQCQNCFRLEDGEKGKNTEGEGDVLARELNEPLSGINFGIKDPSDHISQVYQSPKV